MLQLCSDLSCYSFDLKHEVPQAQMQGLHHLLEDNGTVKIMHDCRQAAAVLFYERGVTVQNVFDTQVSPNTGPSEFYVH